MTCDTEAADVWPAKHPSAALDYAMSFEVDCARLWNKWTQFTAGNRIRVFIPGHASGYEFEASATGRTGGRMPSFPTEVGLSVKDGSLTWVGAAISSASLVRTINGTPTWSGDGLTITSPSLMDLRAVAKIASGIDGQDYPVEVSALTSDGLTIVKTAILPVRIPVRQCG